MRFEDVDYNFQVHTRNARLYLRRFWEAHTQLLRLLERLP